MFQRRKRNRVWGVNIRLRRGLTCHQRALGWTLLHQNHVLQQGAVSAVAPRSRIPEVGAQVAAGEEGGAEGEGWLQASVLLRRGDLEGRKKNRY